jgi:hypothetical protein
MKRAVIYLRVSTVEQTTANQELALREVAERAGWQIDKVYKDHGISGGKGRDKRPGFDAMCSVRRPFGHGLAGFRRDYERCFSRAWPRPTLTGRDRKPSHHGHLHRSDPA